MRIPHVNAGVQTPGTRGPDREGPMQLDTRGMGAGMQGLSDLARGVGVVGQVMAQDQAQQRDDDVALARAKAANAQLQDDIDTDALVSDVQAQVADGSLHYEDAPEVLQTRLSEREAPTIAGLDPVGMEHFTGGLQRNRHAATLKVDAIVQGAKRAEFRGQFDQGLDLLGKKAVDPAADLGDLAARIDAFVPMAQRAGYDPATAGKMAQAAKDKLYYDNAHAWLTTVRDDPKGLDALEASLTTEGGRFHGKLDADKQTALISQIQTRRTQLEAKAESLTNKAEALGLRTVKAVQDQVASLIPPTADTMAKWQADIANATPETQAAFREEVQGIQATQELLRMPLAEQAKVLDAERTALHTTGGSPREKAILDRKQAAFNQQAKLLRENPFAYHALRTGEVVPPLDMAGLMSGDLAAVQAQIADRMTTLASMRKQYGIAGNAPLMPQEAKALGEALQRGTPQQVAKLFGTLHKAMGDDVAYRGAMQQIAPDSPVTALAGMLHPRNGNAAALVLAGESILNRTKAGKGEDGKGGAFPMPPPKDFDAALADAFGDTFAHRPEAFEIAKQAVRAYYAGGAAGAGDLSGELDPDRIRRAINATVGRKVSIGSSDVLAPVGMDEDDFEDKLDDAWQATLVKLPANAPVVLDRYGLKQGAEDGQYYVTQGRYFLHDRDGNKVLLRVNP